MMDSTRIGWQALMTATGLALGLNLILLCNSDAQQPPASNHSQAADQDKSAPPVASTKATTPSQVVKSAKPYKPAALTPAAKEGEKYFRTLNCSECHSVANQGGCLAPPLDGVGGRRTKRYMELRLGKDTEQQFIALVGHPELFPHPRFERKTVGALIAYLLTLPEPRQGFVVSPHVNGAAEKPKESVNKAFKYLPITADSCEGRRLFLENNCMACHALGAVGGFMAPRLDGIGGRRSRQFIESQISNPQAHVRTGPHSQLSKMPQHGFMPNEIKQIADFLLTLPPQKTPAAGLQ